MGKPEPFGLEPWQEEILAEWLGESLVEWTDPRDEEQP